MLNVDLGLVVFGCRSKLLLGQIRGMGMEMGFLHYYRQCQLQDVMQSLVYSADAWLLNIQVVLQQFSSLKNLTVLLKSLIFCNVIIMYYYLIKESLAFCLLPGD